jgi:hypothetical protein
MNTDNFNASRAETLGFFIYNLNLLPVVVIGEYFFNKDGIPPIYLPSRCGYRSTEKIGSQREKLSLKTYKIPRVGLDKKFGSFFIYAIFFPFSLTSGIKTESSLNYCFSSCCRYPCRKANKLFGGIPK